MDRKILIGLALTLFIILFIAVYWAFEPTRQSAAKARQTTEAATRGAELYTANCALCHGQKGEGLIGPPLRPDLAREYDEEELIRTIARGRPGTAMPAWGEEEGGPLKEHQIKDLVIFIKNWDKATRAAQET